MTARISVLAQPLAMHLPQELRDHIATHARSVKVAVALLAAPKIIAVIAYTRRQSFLNQLIAFMQSDLALRNGIRYVTDYDPADIWVYLAESDGRIGAWTLTDEVQNHFVRGIQDSIYIERAITHRHSDAHYWALHDTYSHDNIALHDATYEEGSWCVDKHMACLLALAGYFTDAQGRVCAQKKRPGTSPGESCGTLQGLCARDYV